MKIIGAILIFLSSIICTYTYEKCLKKRISYLEEATVFINHIKSKIEYFSIPISQIYEEYENKTEFIELLINTRDINTLAFDKESKNALLNFFSSIGKGFKKEQISLCEYTNNQLVSKIEQLKKEYPSKTKVFRSISLFIGISIIILLV